MIFFNLLFFMVIIIGRTSKTPEKSGYKTKFKSRRMSISNALNSIGKLRENILDKNVKRGTNKDKS
jgi:hypothetical protein